jgi:hypothetical protein
MLMEYRINPHFHSIELLITQLILMMIIATMFLRAYLQTKNRPAISLFFANLAMIVGYLASLFGYLFYPNNLSLQAWYGNIVAEMCYFAGWTYFSIAGIYLKFRKMPVSYAILIFVFGLTAVGAAAYFFEPFSLTQEEGLSFNRNFLIDFVQYVLAVIMVMLYASAFYDNFRKITNRFGITLVVVGFGLALIGANTIAIIPDPQLTIVAQLIVNIGLAMIIAGFLWMGRTLKGNKDPQQKH